MKDIINDLQQQLESHQFNYRRVCTNFAEANSVICDYNHAILTQYLQDIKDLQVAIKILTKATKG